MTPRKPVRIRKARWTGTCPICRGAILRGQLVTSENRLPWVHALCLIADRRAREPFSVRQGKDPAA